MILQATRYIFNPSCLSDHEQTSEVLLSVEDGMLVVEGVSENGPFYRVKLPLADALIALRMVERNVLAAANQPSALSRMEVDDEE